MVLDMDFAPFTLGFVHFFMLLVCEGVMLFFFLQGSINRWKSAKHLNPFAHMLTNFAVFGCLWLYHGEPFFQHYQKIARGNMVLLVEQNGQVSFQKLAGWQLSGVMFW